MSGTTLFVFTTVESSNYFRPTVSGTVQVLIVGGGGGGGGGDAGGGGGGGVVYIPSVSVTAGTEYPIVVGGGGPVGTNGTFSSAFTSIAAGGGRGGNYPSGNGSSGGCGGGAAPGDVLSYGGLGDYESVFNTVNIKGSNNNAILHGFRGGNMTHVVAEDWRGAGGGGAGAPGFDTNTNTRIIDGGQYGLGSGGEGVMYDILGPSHYWAGGGGGGEWSAGRGGWGGKGGGGGGASDYNTGGPGGGTALTVGGTGASGAVGGTAGSGGANTGGGGGGGSWYNGGGAGGSGIVVIRYIVPSAPTNVSATAPGVSNQVTVTWRTAISNGSTISGYRIEISTNQSTWTDVSAGSGDTSKSVSGLTNGTLYYFRIFTRSNAGDSVASSTVNATPYTAYTAPSVPRDIRATASSARVDLSWNAPGSDGGVSITGYSVTRTNVGAQTSVTVAVNPGTIRTATALGLTNGTLYTFTITATNGAGFTSSGQVTETPFTVPNTPRNFTAVAGVRLVDLSWSPPLFNGGRDISSYLIQRSNNGINAWGSDISTNASINTFRVTELGNNTRYYFRIYAINIAGPTLDPSLADTTTFDFPGQPQDLSAIPGNGLVTLTWTAPLSNGGSPITSYSITNNYSEGTVTFLTAVSATVSGLTNKSYDFSLVAITAVGNSPTPAIYNGVIPFTTPSAPTGVLATAGNAKVDLSWNSATSNGSTITNYRIEISENLSTWATAVTVSGGETSKSVSPLTNGTPYYFRVITISSNAGNSPPSSISSPVTPIGEPNAPINVTATSRNAEAIINWSPPINDGGRPITSYSVTSYSVTSSSVSFQVTTANGSTRRATIGGLTNGTPYTFRVIATNVIGSSTAYGESNIVTPNGPPLTNKKVAISNDGKVVALSSSYQSDISKGRIYVYELSYNQAPYSWNQLGLSSEIIVGLSNDDQFGWDLALSSNGRVVAGSSIASDESGINCGQVRLFELSSNTNSWIQKGFAINGQTLAGESGYSISLEGNGNRIAIGAWKDNSNGNNAGAVRVYDFSANVDDWRQQGQTLLGDSGSYEGYSTALSSDGLTLATGCLNVNNANNIINAGKVKTFTWSGTTWENKGIIQGADISYLYFGRALKLSANGNTIVVGAPGNNSGQVYRYQGGTTWTQLGQTLVGISGGDEFGTSVAISNDGTIVSIGSDNNSSNRGHVRVFAYANNYWNQLSNVLSGKTATSKAGIHALSGDGTTLIQSNNTYNTVYGINKTLAVSAPMTTISGNLLVMGNISVNSLDISTNHIYRSDGYSYKMFDSDLSSAIMKEYYSDVISTRNLKVQITGNGAITNRTNSYKAFSDSRLKENIVTSGPKLADLLKVRVVDYTMKGSTNTKYIGVLAQELEDLFPNLVTELEPSPKDIEDGRTIKYKAVNYSSFDAILIKSLQEQNAMLKNITKRIEAIDALEEK